MTTGLFAQVQNYSVGDVVDDFTVTDTDGNVWNLYDLTSQGKYVYLDFFFDTCGPCQGTTPLFNEFHDKYGCNEGNVFMISINNGSDSDAEVIAFENEFGGDFTHAPAVSAEGGSAAVDTNLGIPAYPTFCLIGSDNTLLINDIWPIANLGTFENTIPTDSNAVPMQCSLGVNDALVADFSIFPNPSTGSQINIALGNNAAGADVTIYNVLGSVVYTNSFSQNTFAMHANLSSGSYIVSITTEAGTANKSVVVK
jgi:thiol-disulfide isomerase/thioredoxin